MRKPRSTYNYLARAADKKRGELLGMKFPTAQRQMMKSVLFELAKKNGSLLCYRCDKPITTTREFSLDHRDSWQKASDPRAAFFDFTNIAFSHLTCNAKAGGEMCGGEGHYKAKLTEQAVREIRQKWKKGGVFLRELGVEYGLSVSGVHAVIKLRSWKHVTE